MADAPAPAINIGNFGKCCGELKDAISGEEFEPLITVGEDGILYMSVGLVDLEDDEPGMVDHPMFFCPFCGKGVQTQEEVRAKSAETDEDDGDA
jgi:hypothetical protein